MPINLKWGRVALVLLLIVIGAVWWFQRPAKVPVQSRPVPRAFALTNAPTANLKAVMTPMSAVTNQTIKELISAANQFRAAGAAVAPAAQPAKKYYTADQPLPRQVASLQRLHADSSGTLQAYLRPESHVPIQLKGYPLAEPDPTLVGQPNGDELMAKRFLQSNRDVLLLNEPDAELRLNHRETDKLGRTVLRFSQFYRGLEVWPGEIGVHSDPAGAIDLVHTTTVPTPEGIDTTPRLTAEQATQRARTSVPGGLSSTNTEPKLLIYAPLDQPAKLAWKLELSFGLDQHWQVVVDAQTGNNLKAVNMCMCANVPGSGVDLLGVTRPLNVDQQGSFYLMRNVSKPMFNAATTNGVIEILDARNATSGIYYTVSPNPNVWTNADAVSAAFNFSQTYDYYLQRHGRNSFDGNGSSLRAIVRIGGLANAYWDHNHKRMGFGDADRYPASLDVTGHEVTHGVIHSIGANPILDYENQSGALNESFSDIFGEMIEARSNGGLPDWLIGAVLNQTLRNMSNPPAIPTGAGFSYPRRMSELIAPTDSRLNGFENRDKGGVHINSGIMNRAYFLIAAGLSGSLGIPDSEAIFYRCLTTKFLPQSQFIDARLGCIASAEELFGVGSRQVLKVAEGFDAIELFGAPVKVDQSPTNLPAVSAPDSALWVYFDATISGFSLARRETALGDPTNGVKLVGGVKFSRPSVTGNGSVVAYVTAGNSLALLNTSGGTPNLYAVGQVHSAAFSPLANFAAIVLRSNGLPTSQIVLLDLVNSLSATVNLKTPVFDSSPISNISYADSLTFSPDGSQLVFDALSTSTDPDGRTFSAWSIYSLDMASLDIKVLIPPNAELQSGNPCFSKTSSRFILFETVYGSSSVPIVADLERGTLGAIAAIPGRLGYPCFTGDDSAIIYADADGSVTTGVSLYRQGLSADKLAASGTRTRWVGNSSLGVLYRFGTYAATNSPPTVTFTSPANGTIFTSPANFTLSYSASDPDGSIAKVELYEGSTLLITDTSAPFSSFNASNFAAGFHRYHLRAYDNRGAATTSSPLRIAIKPSQTNGVFTATGTKRFELALGTTNTGSYRLEYSTNLVNWISLGSTESLSNAVYFSDTGVTNHPRRFYRAVRLP